MFELWYKQKEADNWQKASKNDIAQLDDQSRFTVPGDADGITLTTLKAGFYKLVEIAPPTGYVINNDTPVVFEVKRGEIDNTTGTLDTVTYDPAVAAVEADEENNIPASDAVPATFTIPNTPGAELPHTGGPGTRLFTLTGLMLIFGAGAMFCGMQRRECRRRRYNSAR